MNSAVFYRYYRHFTKKTVAKTETYAMLYANM